RPVHGEWTGLAVATLAAALIVTFGDPWWLLVINFIVAIGGGFALAVWLFIEQRLLIQLSGPGFALITRTLALLAESKGVGQRLTLFMRLVKRENEALQTELSQVAEIARVLLPAKVPRWPGVRIGAYHRPLTQASGDWYAFEQAPSGRYLHFLL